MKTTIAGDYIKVQNYTPHNTAAHRKKREKSRKETAAAMKRYNERMKAEKLQFLIILNFSSGYMVTLKYGAGNHPVDYMAADNMIMSKLRGLKRELKRTGRELKYIAVTERGKICSGLHHHVLVDSLEYALMLKERWDGYVSIEPLKENGAYKDLAAYLCKQDTKEELPKGKSAYHVSRNLEQPRIEYKLVPDKWEEKPTPPKGYEIIPDTLINGFNNSIGIKYQSYMLKRQIDPKYRQMDRKDKKRRGVLFGNVLKKMFGRSCSDRTKGTQTILKYIRK